MPTNLIPDKVVGETDQRIFSVSEDRLQQGSKASAPRRTCRRRPWTDGAKGWARNVGELTDVLAERFVDAGESLAGEGGLYVREDGAFERSVDEVR